MATKFRSGIFLFLICGVASALIFFLGISLSGAKRNLQKEVAQRLETEEAMLKMENQRTALATQLRSLGDELGRIKGRADALAQELTQERSSRQALQSAYEKAQGTGQNTTTSQTP